MPESKIRQLTLSSLVAASFFVAGTVCAQSSQPASAGQAPAQEATAPQPFVTAPSIKPSLLHQEGLADAGYSKRESDAAEKTAAPTVRSAEAAATADKDISALNFLLGPSEFPATLRYSEREQSSRLSITPPSEADAKMLLPGEALDAAADARYTIGRYISDLMGETAQRREMQKNSVRAWSEKTRAAAQHLTVNPWQRYQFNRLARTELLSYKEGIEQQAAPEFEKVASEFRSAIEKISKVIPHMPTHQAKQAWYNLMVQAKEGFATYQDKALSLDSETLGLIDKQLAQYPELPRPAGEPPQPKPARNAAQPAPAPAAKASAKESEKQLAAKPEQSESSSFTGGLVVLGAVGVGVFMLRRSKKNSAATPNLG